jgi:hypothetical protein
MSLMGRTRSFGIVNSRPKAAGGMHLTKRQVKIDSGPLRESIEAAIQPSAVISQTNDMSGLV